MLPVATLGTSLMQRPSMKRSDDIKPIDVNNGTPVKS
jgi:hypothetical protein